MDSQTVTPQSDFAEYMLLREAGRGAMSTVYEARDPQGRPVAVKVLHAPATLPADQRKALVDRLGREARVMLHLSHPNVVRIFDVGETGDERFLVMEYLDGVTLRQRLDGGPLSLVETSRILDQVAEAVDAVHAQGIIHRDIKPSNVMLLADGRVKLMDFGVARQGGDTTITQTGMIVGSPAYMAPEQVRGADNAPSTDLWALGVLLYEMLAGQSPFGGTNVSTVLYRVAHDQPAAVPGVSGAVQQILRRALDKNPARRYPSGCALAQAFRAAVQPTVKPIRAPKVALPPFDRRQAIAVAVPALLLIGLLVGTVFLTRSHKSLSPVSPHHVSTASTVPFSQPVVPLPSVKIREVTKTSHPVAGAKKPAATTHKAPARAKSSHAKAAARHRLLAWQNHLRRLHQRKRSYHHASTRRHRTRAHAYYWRSGPSSAQHMEHLHNFTWSGGYNW